MFSNTLALKEIFLLQVSIADFTHYTVQPKNDARARTSFYVRKKSTSCGFLRVTCAWILQAARTSLRLEVKTARTSLR